MTLRGVRYPVLAVVITLVLGVPAFLIVRGWDGGDEGAGADAGVTLEEITDSRGDHLGETVTLSAEIHEIINEKVFVIGPADEPSNRVVVVSSEPLAAQAAKRPPSDGDLVKVTGTVDAIDLDEVGDHASPLGREAERLLESEGLLEDRPSLRAERVVLTPRKAEPGDAARTTAREVLENRDKYLGELTTVRGRASEVHGPRSFSIGGLLVVSGLESVAMVERDDFVEVTGLPRPFQIGDFERAVDADLPGALSRFKGQPALRATRVDLAVPQPHRESGVDGEP